MSCLSDAHIQSMADGDAGVYSKDGEAGETSAADRAHLASCERCQLRLRDRESVMQTIAQAMRVPDAMPPGMSLRIERALAEGAASGATRLRESRAARRSWPSDGRVVWSAGAVAVATILAVVFVAPVVKLARTAQTTAGPE